MSSFFKDTRRLTIVAIFAFHGVVDGTFFSRLADLQAATGLGDGSLGLALSGLPIGMFFGCQMASRPIEEAGVRNVLSVALPLAAAGPMLTALLASGGVSFFLLLLIQGAALAAVNVAMNVEADRIEAADGRRIMNRCHASWALGFAVAGLAGTGAVAIGIPPAWHFAGVFALLSTVGLVIVRRMAPSPPRYHDLDEGRSFARPTVAILLIMGFGISGMWLEGATRNWGVIYLRDVDDPARWLDTFVLPLILAFQVIGRLAADRLIDRFGPVGVARALTATTLVGLAVVAADPPVPVTLVGFALIGLGISTAQPQANSAAAQLGDRPSSANVAALLSLQTVLWLISPPLIGAAAAEFGIKTTFALFLPLPLISLYFARYLRARES